MVSDLTPRPAAAERMRPFLDRLAALYDAMDSGYRAAAAHYGFDCQGCADNCCRTRFYHHTWLEYGYLAEGFQGLESEQRREIGNRAEAWCRAAAEADRLAAPLHRMCPLNLGGRCVLYRYRPMICRLHGLPHELHPPARSVQYHRGCAAFDRRCGHRTYYKFDRTPFYRQMASLEKSLKDQLGLTAKVRLTVARMICLIRETSAP